MRINVAVLLCVLSFLSCSPITTKKTTAVPEDTRTVVIRSRGDTAHVIVEFANEKERTKFLAGLDEYLRRKAGRKIAVDTVRHYVHFLIPDSRGTKADSIIIARVGEDTIEESIISRDTASDTAGADSLSDTAALPEFGGIASLYSHKHYLDIAFGRLLVGKSLALATAPRQNGFGDTIVNIRSRDAYLSASASSPVRIVLKLKDNAKSGDGKSFSAFDLVDAWNKYAKKHPAESKAIFRYVKGMEALLRGEEAIIPGIQVVDEHTITLHLRRPDPRVFTRLQNIRLIPAACKAGPYYIAKGKEGKLLLQANSHYPAGRPFLDKCKLAYGIEENAFLSYSLNAYDAITLQQTRDLEYARSKFADGAQLLPISHNRYFLALNLQDKATRSFLHAIVKPNELLNSYVKMEGRVVKALYADTLLLNVSGAGSALPQAPFVSTALRILYRQDDRPSVMIADKLLADLTSAGVPCELTGKSGNAYEQALINRGYDIAIGWAPESITGDVAEQLRVATIWFGDEADEISRISSRYEIPLFSITQYLLCKKKLNLYQDRLVGIHLTDSL
ncbi:MAG: hypothetical protein GF398_21725 [Chitinivibrionales bacterium]|nr:hypothetical protein [Chitinivibrionales bacterium]